MAVWGLHVSIIEPGIMQTPIIEKYDQLLLNSHTELSNDVRERWGDEFFKQQLAAARSNILLKYAENPVKVVRALQHAIMSTSPQIRYRPGWQSSYIFFPLSILPASLVDICIAKTPGVNMLPFGIKKQLKT